MKKVVGGSVAERQGGILPNDQVIEVSQTTPFLQHDFDRNLLFVVFTVGKETVAKTHNEKHVSIAILNEIALVL